MPTGYMKHGFNLQPANYGKTQFDYNPLRTGHPITGGQGKKFSGSTYHEQLARQGSPLFTHLKMLQEGQLDFGVGLYEDTSTFGRGT
jgi:hypothetical protein